MPDTAMAPNGATNGLAHAGPLLLSVIRIDGGTQSRDSINQGVVDDYAAAIEGGTEFPPVVVFYDGTEHWLADGFHRYHATAKAGRLTITAEVRQGTRRDAILHSVGANEEHGLRRTNEDKRRAVMALLGDAEWSAWSDREIARVCRVSQPFVGKCRPVTENVISERQYKTKHGTTATMRTAPINKGREPKEPSREVRRNSSAEFMQDPDAQAEAEAAERDRVIERDERIALAGADGLVAENEKLQKTIADLEKRIAVLTSEKGTLARSAEHYKKNARTWEKRAREAGWKDA